jgi:flagellar M-ring protein FliF
VPNSLIAEPSGFMSYLQFTKDDVMHWVELLIMLLLGLVVLLLVVRPLVRRMLAPDGPMGSLGAAMPAIAADVAAPEGGPAAAVIAAGNGPDDIKAVPSKTSKMIDIAQVQGQVHAQSVQKVGELADKNPNEAVSIIRSWLNEAA